MKRPLLVLTSCIQVLFLATASQAAQSADWMAQEDLEHLVSDFREVLPIGWAIHQVTTDRPPFDWHTFDDRGIQIDVSNGVETFRTWILPVDWVGIRRVQPGRQRVVYWEGILANPHFKSITDARSESIHEALQKLLGRTPSLVNGGWRTAELLFRNRMREIDAQAQALVERFCSDMDCRDEAAHSLIVLGVPSRTLSLDCAEHGRGEARNLCVDSLGYMGGEDSTRLLESLVAASSTDADVRRYAAFSLRTIADPASAPALHRVLQLPLELDFQTVYSVVGALARFDYQPAAPDILRRMQSEPPDAIQQRYYPHALAALRYAPAIPVLEARTPIRTFTAEWVAKQLEAGWRESPAVALMTLTAPWGESSDGVRLLLLPSEEPAGQGPVHIAVVIENTGTSVQPLLMDPRGLFILDGQRQPPGVLKADGFSDLHPRDVAPFILDISRWFKDAGEHRIQYQLGSAVSNELIVKVTRE